MIGADFERIHFVLFGLQLQEPMAIVTDTIIGSMGVIFGIKLLKLKQDTPFFKYWIYFFITFGFSTFWGGLGHTFYAYFDVIGRVPSWITAVISLYFLEKAMITKIKSESRALLFDRLAIGKMIIVLSAIATICAFGPIHEKPQLGFLPIAVDTILAVIIAPGILGRSLAKSESPLYNYFYHGVLVMLPSAFIFLFKINIHQWLDKNDLSHVFLGIGLVFFYVGVKKLALENKSPETTLETEDAAHSLTTIAAS